MNIANEYLHRIPQIEDEEEAVKYGEHDVFLFSHNMDFICREDCLIETFGLDSQLDKRPLDLIRIIKVIDPLNISYLKTNILTPLAFAEQQSNIPWHITTQAILFTKVSQDTINWIKSEIKKNRYGKHIYDKFWLPFGKDINEIVGGDILCVFNRRVAGWDGSHERPVIELLGAGGHLPTVWDAQHGFFRELEISENIQKEFAEELGGEIDKKGIVVFGGYQNDITHELVILCGIELDDNNLKTLQEYAIQNIDLDTEGIYLGIFSDVIDFYLKNPDPFAGGKKAAPYNFPNRKDLMDRVVRYFKANDMM